MRTASTTVSRALELRVMVTRYAHHESALGPLLFLARDGALSGLFFSDQPHAPTVERNWRRDDEAEIFTQATREIDEFIAGHRREFDVPVALTGTPFQRQVWREIATIEYGRTRTYGEIAARLGAFARAVGTAAGRNPICLLIPCHRVVGAGGALVGYAGGLDRKERLLKLERSPVLQTATRL
jgi:methylated-DNA-[protein]-cysteine S-methyltransferase